MDTQETEMDSRLEYAVKEVRRLQRDFAIEDDNYREAINRLIYIVVDLVDYIKDRDRLMNARQSLLSPPPRDGE